MNPQQTEFCNNAILIPERQNPLLVSRIVYFQDLTFLKIFEAQTGPLPYPSSETAEVQGLAARLDAKERKIAALGQIEYVRKAVTAEGPKEPPLAAALVAPKGVVVTGVMRPEVEPDLAVLTPAQTVAARRMAGFEGKLAEMGG